MNLEEEIQNEEEKAMEYKIMVNQLSMNMSSEQHIIAMEWHQMFEYHRQLAEWLKELKRIWDSGDCNDCKFSGHCEIQPKVGQLVRFNCYHFSRIENEEVNADEDSD